MEVVEYSVRKPDKAGFYDVKLEGCDEVFPAYWSIMWNQFKVADVLLHGVTHWWEKSE